MLSSLPGQQYNTSQPPNISLTCFRCGEQNTSTRLYCIICGDDLSNKRASADRYLAPNGLPLLARLSVQTGPLTGRSFRFHQDTTTIGRATGNDLIITGRTVSRHHAQLIFAEGHWFAEDLKSANGTLVNGRRLQQRTQLKDGDTVNFGDERVVFNIIIGGQSRPNEVGPGSRMPGGPGSSQGPTT
jgi:eukaryotic-like serine/threonine-protein kinase